MHSEFYQLDQEAADIINQTKQSGGRVVCVGTTSCRTVESAAARLREKALTSTNAECQAGIPLSQEIVQGNGYETERIWVKPCSGWTDIFIYPGYQFKVLDQLITNFHLPESTLIMLVSALAGRERVLNAYQAAVSERYRFFSFGDAMLIK